MSHATTPSIWQDRAHGALRIIAGAAFTQHGLAKVFGLLTDQPPVPLLSLIGVAGAIELFGGLLLLVGLITRPVAFLSSGLMAVAYFMAHAPKGFWPVQNGGELAVLYCFIFLYFSAAGSGAWGLDRVWRRGDRIGRVSSGRDTPAAAGQLA